MDLCDAAERLTDLLAGNRSVFLKTDPEVPDHTSRQPFKAVVCSDNGRLEVEVTPENVKSVVGMFDYTVFDKEHVDRLYCWNLKSLATYFHAFCPHQYLRPGNSVIDLKVVESFLKVRQNAPENLAACVHRVKQTVQNKSWQPIYKAVHLPLTLKVLPSIETTPLLNEASRRCEYPYYEIEGILSGRLNCTKKFAYCYVPHNMGPEVRAVLKPRGYRTRFLCADFRHCEVTVLQWLSNDERLRQLLDTGGDLHALIYREITGDECDSDTKRKMSKLVFFPVMYGCGPKRLAEQLRLTEDVGRELVQRVRTRFRTAYEWLIAQRDRAAKGVIMDHSGRPRDFTQDPYRAQDFVVQGTAATACQEKLIELHDRLDGDDARIAHSVHDGFGLVVKIDAARDAYKAVKATLEGESKLCPGLSMKVSVKFGAKLDNLKELWKD